MRGVVLAGGSGSRLAPLTNCLNKHLLPVGTKPMIYYPIEKLVEADIREIMIITGTEHMGNIVQTLGSGKKFNCNFTYRVQDEAGGIAQALGLAKGFSYGEKICVILGDNIFEDGLQYYMYQYARQDKGAMVLLKDVPDPKRYGVADVDTEENKILSIEEKPLEPKSTLAVIGTYFYDYKVFDIIDKLKPSGRGEIEITDVNNQYLEWGELNYMILKGYWTDAGTHNALARASALVARA